MKTRILIAVIVGLLYWNTSAQTADDWVSQGRSYLVAHDLTDANACFAQALAIDPVHETANALYAITSILVLPSQPEGSNFLTRIGFPADGRSIYAWTSQLPTNSNGLLIAPADVNANEFTSQLRTNVLPAIAGAIGNLSAITDTNFILVLTSDETSIGCVTVDYGDFKLIQSGLYGAEYFIYLLNSQNCDAQLTAIQALYTNNTLSIESLLTSYPQLLTFATTNDLEAASAAFTNGVNAYMIASAFISARPTNEIRLFNYDEVSAQKELDFRSTLQDLENSLAGAQVLTIDTNLTVNLGNQFDGSTTWRSLLPTFDGDAIELGSLPDLTFGGIINGLTTGDMEGFLSGSFQMLPVGSAPNFLSDDTPEVAFTTLSGHYYIVEASTNLLDWQPVTGFTATNATSTLVDLQGVKLSERFYRLLDVTGHIALTGMVLDQSTGLPITGAQVQNALNGATTFTDSNGQFYFVTSTLANHEIDLQISAVGYGTLYSSYYGEGLISGLNFYLSP